jgi:hypothetical protein
LFGIGNKVLHGIKNQAGRSREFLSLYPAGA